MYFKKAEEEKMRRKNWFHYEMGLSPFDNFVLKLLAFVIPYFFLILRFILEYHFKYETPKIIL